MLVVALGILAVLGLFPAGLDQAVRSEEETHAAQFAEEVFAGMRAWAEEYDFDELLNYELPVSAESVWDDESLLANITFTTDIVTNVYRIKVDGGSILNHAFRYRLIANNLSPNRTAATLYIRSGEFGPFENPMVFYTEIYRFEP